ncbi:peptidoglycan DD-metalloendopeptidase family protein [Gallaecimonas sp. GXIMD4217]|uniref:M23 family metallopeptidase n=1 Tax=Gallaecimonas sp. GXIMD4217 TaxID=3131927 RepID=UPI00311ABEF2
MSSLRETLHITISGLSGTRHLALTVKRRNALIAALTAVVLVLLGMAGYIRFLHWQADDAGRRLAQNRAELSALTDELNAARADYAKVEQDRQLLETAIARKAEELTAVTSRLDDLEDKLGSGAPELPQLDTLERVDLASLAMNSRQVSLNMIPNGDPLDYAYISSSFGKRKHPVKKRTIHHAGLDMVAHVGTPVYATADGVVELVSRRKTGYGTMMLVSHAFGFKTRYAHLKSIAVKRGAYVRKGELIAYSGNSGTSTGPHLHYEVSYAGIPLNPKPFVDWQIDNYDRLFDVEKKVPWPSLITTIESLRTLWQPQLSQPAPLSTANSTSPATSTLTATSKALSVPTSPFASAVTAK